MGEGTGEEGEVEAEVIRVKEDTNVFNENQIPSYTSDINPANDRSTAATEESNANELTPAPQGAEGTSGDAGEDKPVLHFDETKDHYAGEEEEKNFAESVAPEKANTRKGYNNRGGSLTAEERIDNELITMIKQRIKMEIKVWIKKVSGLSVEI